MHGETVKFETGAVYFRGVQKDESSVPLVLRGAKLDINF
jgi:hypothetical protein